MTTEYPVEVLAAVLKATYLAHGFFITTHKGFRQLEVKDDIANIVWIEAIPRPIEISSGLLKNRYDSYQFIEERVFLTASAFGVFVEKEDASTGFRMLPIEGWPGLLELMSKIDIKPAENADPQTDRLLFQKGNILAQEMKPSVETVFFLSADKQGAKGRRRYNGEVYARICDAEDCPKGELPFELSDRLIDTNEAGSHQWVENHWRHSGGPALGFVRHGIGGWQQIFGAIDKAEALAALMATRGQPQIA